MIGEIAVVLLTFAGSTFWVRWRFGSGWVEVEGEKAAIWDD
jgi:hypothetical protein